MDNGARDDLDRGLVEAMRELRSLAQIRVPTSSQKRVDREVEAAISRLAREEEQPMNQAALATPTVGPVSAMSAAASGRLQRRWPALPWLATAALLAVTLGFSYAAFRSLGFGPAHLTTLPAAFVQGGTPETTSETHFSVTFPAPVLPAGPVYAWSTLYEVAPGVSADYPGFTIEDPVAALVWVQSGSMAIAGEPVAVHRAVAGPPGASPTPGELVLGAGDAVGVELGPGRSYELRSVGSEPLVFAEFWLVGGPRPLYTYPREYQILDYANHPEAATLTAPATFTMRLTQAILAPEETLAPAEGSWQLALADRRAWTPGIGSVIARESRSGAVENMGQAPASVVAMTAEFRETTATPAG
ncbi:MAG: hypothetical protein K0Q89_528 [Thermomicrobiales bacterium]|jgi:hypothetical protein|nr:hypothetical protein [Thermomicrobiales bacterium]